MSLFHYFDLGLSAMNAAQVGLQVAGDNIANINTPGYARRRVELISSRTVPFSGTTLESGVDVVGIRRLEDRLVQATLQREQGAAAFHDRKLDGLRELESVLGTVDGDNLLRDYGRFSEAFSGLAAKPEDTGLRVAAINSADTLAGRLRDTYNRIRAQRNDINRGVEDTIGEVNRLSDELAALNREIRGLEGGGSEAVGTRDRRRIVVERLVELTGASTGSAEGDAITLQLPSGSTLVNSEKAFALSTAPGVGGTARVLNAQGADITDRLRSGELGAQLAVRDDAIPPRLADLDAIATDLTTRGNQLTSYAFDLNGDPGGPLFEPDPPSATGSAATIRVSSSLLGDPRKLAVSATGAPADGLFAQEIANLIELGSPTLAWRTPADVLSGAMTEVGGEIAQTDVNASVSRDVVANLQARRDAASAVSLDEEAVELIRNQRAYEAAARFFQVINEITEVAVNLG